MSRTTAAVGALLVLSACSRDSSGFAGRGSGAPASGGDSFLNGPEEPKKFALAPAKLTAYVQYQRRMAQVHREIAGLQPSGSEKDAIRALAVAEEKARTETGLSRSELKAIDQMVREIIGKRVHAGDLFRADTLRRLEEMKARLPPERRHDAEQSIAQLKREQDEFSTLSEERKKYGDSNVDAILTREPELTQCWKEAMALFAATAAK